MKLQEKQYMKIIKRMASNNVQKFAKLDPAKTYKKAFITNEYGIVELFINPDMNIGISLDKSTTYRLSDDSNQVKKIMSNQYVCVDFKIAGVYTKCSRNVLISHLFGSTETTSTKSVDSTKKTTIVASSNKHIVINEDFDPAKTYVDQSFGFNLVRNEGINVYFDMDNRTFYTNKGAIIKSTNGIKSVAYVVYKKDGKYVRKTIMQDHIIAMMYGLTILKNTMVCVIDDTKPLTKDNITLIPKSKHLSKVMSGKVQSYATSKAKQENDRNIISSYVTEDFSKFTDQDEALNHQIKVDKAKDIVQLMRNSGCAYGVVEQAFLKVMDTERSQVSYKNFVDVINNNNGILEVKKESLKVELNVNIDTLLIDFTKKEEANNLICEIKDRVNKLKSL